MKDLKGFEKYYSVTKNGEIFSKRNNIFLKKSQKENGYEYIELNINGNNSWHRVHRLIALTFIDNLENKPYINHKNGIKNDNRVKNLEWVTGSENNNHAIKTGLFQPKQKTFQIVDKDNKIIINQTGLSNFLSLIDFKSSSLYNYFNMGYIPRGKYKNYKINIIK